MNAAALVPPDLLYTDSDPLLDFEADLEESAHALDLEPWVLQRLKHPEREITVNLPLVRDDGSAVNITGYRVQHSRSQAPSIGPVVISPESHAAGLRVSAAEITLQSALLGLRLGGAAGAIVCDAGQFSERELRHVVKDYVSSLRENIGPLSDVLARQGDDCLAAWMNDANTAAHGQSEPAAIVGSAPDLARVTPHAIVALIQHVLESISGLHIAIQGFGRRGRILAEVLHHAGAHIVAIADRSGGITCEYGIDIVALNHYVEEHSVLFGFPAAEAATNSDVLQCPADVLILAAAERQIGQHNAACMRSRLLIELTSGAVTRAGEKSLPTGCMFIPHLLAGAPELAVWAHEWQRGLSYSAPDPQQAATDAGAFTLHAFDRVRDMAEAQEISLRQAAVMMAVESLATSLRKR